VAEFLVGWAVRSASDRVLDPAFGGGVFLAAAQQRLGALGGRDRAGVYGVELDAQAHAHLVKHAVNLRASNLLCGDFFDLDAKRLPKLQAVVGNPPFIRYQRFAGTARAKAMARAAAAGVSLSGLSSAWAPFVVHAVAVLGQTGRLAMVIPAELVHAAYARPVLEHLIRSFAKVTLITFRNKLFADLSQDTLLVLAEGKGGHTDGLGWLDLEDGAGLGGLTPARLRQVTTTLKAGPLIAGTEGLIEQVISPQARRLYRRLKAHPQVAALGQLAQVGVGYVTGANDYFHLSPAQARKLGLSARFLKPALRRGRGLEGICFTGEDWEAACAANEAGYLFFVNGQTRLPKAVQQYIRYGEAQGIHQAYKCRIRTPWYALPQVHSPDAFLTYMSTAAPRLALNSAQAVAANSLHGVRLYPQAPIKAHALAALWPTSLTELSAELEGHSMGGGMLKLEPSEAARVLVAVPKLSANKLSRLAHRLDELIRAGEMEAGRGLADRVILHQGLGLSQRQTRVLSEAADALRERRNSR
jgi:adenine-specific DNA methylase